MLHKSLELSIEIKNMIEACVNSGTVSLLERDLIKDKIRNLYDVLIKDTGVCCQDVVCKKTDEAIETVQTEEENEKPSVVTTDYEEEDNLNEIISNEEPTIQNEELFMKDVLNKKDSPPQFFYYGDLSPDITQEQLQEICLELFDGNVDNTGNFLTQIESFDDLDKAVLYIQDRMPEKLNTNSVAIIANALINKFM